MNELEENVKAILALAYCGIHHVNWNKRKVHNGMIELNVFDGIATYDFDQLTRLLVACHDRCVRMELGASGPGLLKLRFTQRKNRDGGMFERHPTIEQAIETIRTKS